MVLNSSDINRLDDLVAEYLAFRGFRSTFKHLKTDRSTKENYIDSRKSNVDTYERMIRAFDSGDYPRVLSLWNSYINVDPTTNISTSKEEAEKAEFYVNLSCATFPFRKEVIQAAGSPEVAARLAARSMTIFKHYLESRGRPLLNYPEFQIYKNLHKIAFPPTHPNFTHLFRTEWITSIRDSILAFLNKYFETGLGVLPELIKMYQNSNNIDYSPEPELKLILKKRERKLMEFSQSLFEISKDLLISLESGKAVGKDFLHDFRMKFNDFQDIFSANSDNNSSDASDGSLSRDISNEDLSIPNHNFNSKLDSIPEKSIKTKSRKSKQLRHTNFNNPKIYNYQLIRSDLHSMVKEVNDGLVSIRDPTRRFNSVDAELCCQSAMQASLLLRTLRRLLSRPDLPSTDTHTLSPSPKRDRGEEKGGGGYTSTDTTSTSPSTPPPPLPLLESTLSSSDIASELFMQHDLLCFLSTHDSEEGMISLMPKITERNTATSNTYSSDGSSSGGGSLAAMVATLSLVLTKFSQQSAITITTNLETISKPKDKLISAAVVLSSYISRFIASLCVSPKGSSYFTSSTGHLMTSLLSLLLSLPLTPSTSTSSSSSSSTSSSNATFESLAVDLITAMVCLGLIRPQYLASLTLRKGGLEWIVKSLTTTATAKSSPKSDMKEALLGFLRLLITSENIRRFMVSSPKLYPSSINKMLELLVMAALPSSSSSSGLLESLHPGASSADTNNNNGSSSSGMSGMLAAETLLNCLQEETMLTLFVNHNLNLVNKLRNATFAERTSADNHYYADTISTILVLVESSSSIKSEYIPASSVASRPNFQILEASLQRLLSVTKDHSSVVKYGTKYKTEFNHHFIGKYLESRNSL